MAKTLIRNPSANPLALPYPMRGALPAGGGVVVDAPVAQVRSALGVGVYELSEVDRTPADAFYLGNLLDPVPWRATLLFDDLGEATFTGVSDPSGQVVHTDQGRYALTPPHCSSIFPEGLLLVDTSEPPIDPHIHSLAGGVVDLHCVVSGTSNSIDPPAGSRLFVRLGLKA